MDDDLNQRIVRALEAAVLEAGEPSEQGRRRTVRRAVGRRRLLVSGGVAVTALMVVLGGAAVGQLIGNPDSIDPVDGPPSNGSRSTAIEITPRRTSRGTWWPTPGTMSMSVSICMTGTTKSCPGARQRFPAARRR